MRIMARHARERFAPLKAVTLPKVFCLIGNMVVFRMFGSDRVVVIIERFTRTVLKCRTAMLERVAVTLSAQIQLAIAGQGRGTHDGMGFDLVRMFTMKADMLTPRTMANFTSYAQESVIVAILVSAPRYMFEPRVMAFNATNRGISREITAAVSVEWACAPSFKWIKPNHRQFVKSIFVPSEIDFVVTAAHPIAERNGGRIHLSPKFRFTNCRFDETFTRFRHFKSQRQIGKGELAGP